MLHDRQSAGPLQKRAIEIGPATVERATCTRGKYEWRDAELEAVKKRKGDDEEDGREGKDGSRRLRPQDPGKR